ncbi:hypothetical protein AAMO2058_000745900 [Amorphochlora amoebiformis]
MVRTRCMVAFLAAVVNAGGLCTIVEVESSLYTGNVAGFNGTTTYRAAERAYGNNINCSFTVQAARLVFLDFCTGTGDFLMIDRAAGSGGSQMLEVFSGKNTLPEVQDSTSGLFEITWTTDSISWDYCGPLRDAWKFVALSSKTTETDPPAIIKAPECAGSSDEPFFSSGPVFRSNYITSATYDCTFFFPNATGLRFTSFGLSGTLGITGRDALYLGSGMNLSSTQYDNIYYADSNNYYTPISFQHDGGIRVRFAKRAGNVPSISETGWAFVIDNSVGPKSSTVTNSSLTVDCIDSGLVLKIDNGTTVEYASTPNPTPPVVCRLVIPTYTLSFTKFDLAGGYYLYIYPGNLLTFDPTSTRVTRLIILDTPGNFISPDGFMSILWQSDPTRLLGDRGFIFQTEALPVLESSPTLAPTASPSYSPRVNVTLAPTGETNAGGGNRDSSFVNSPGFAATIAVVAAASLSGVAYLFFKCWKRSNGYKKGGADSSATKGSSGPRARRLMSDGSLDTNSVGGVSTQGSTGGGHPTSFRKPLARGESQFGGLVVIRDLTIKDKIEETRKKVVYIGIHNGKRVQVQVSSNPNATANWREISETLKYTTHSNICTVLGITNVGKSMGIVSQYCAQGSLDKLHGKKNMDEPKLFLRISLDVTRGLAHLHNKAICHRDIACKNLLMDENGKVLLGGLGIMRRPILERWQWVSPESLKSWKNTKKTDIWSLGATFCEILSKGRKPYGEVYVPIEESIKSVIDGKLTIKVPETACAIGKTVVLFCLQRDVNKRPSVQRILATLEEYHYRADFSDTVPVGKTSDAKETKDEIPKDEIPQDKDESESENKDEDKEGDSRLYLYKAKNVPENENVEMEEDDPRLYLYKSNDVSRNNERVEGKEDGPTRTNPPRDEGVEGKEGDPTSLNTRSNSNSRAGPYGYDSEKSKDESRNQNDERKDNEGPDIIKEHEITIGRMYAYEDDNGPRK